MIRLDEDRGGRLAVDTEHVHTVPTWHHELQRTVMVERDFAERSAYEHAYTWGEGVATVGEIRRDRRDAVTVVCPCDIERGGNLVATRGQLLPWATAVEFRVVAP